jgi:hypothetical protein
MTLQTRDGADTAVFDYTDETSTFGDRLVLAREAAGLGQGELATRMGKGGLATAPVRYATREDPPGRSASHTTADPRD